MKLWYSESKAFAQKHLDIALEILGPPIDAKYLFTEEFP